MARIAGLTRGGSTWPRIIFFMGRRALGQVPEPWRIVALSKRIFAGQIGMERAQMGAKTVPPALKTLAQARAGSLIGCPF